MANSWVLPSSSWNGPKPIREICCDGSTEPPHQLRIRAPAGSGTVEGQVMVRTAPDAVVPWTWSRSGVPPLVRLSTRRRWTVSSFSLDGRPELTSRAIALLPSTRSHVL